MSKIFKIKKLNKFLILMNLFNGLRIIKILYFILLNLNFYFLKHINFFIHHINKINFYIFSLNSKYFII